MEFETQGPVGPTGATGPAGPSGTDLAVGFAKQTADVTRNNTAFATMGAMSVTLNTAGNTRLKVSFDATVTVDNSGFSAFFRAVLDTVAIDNTQKGQVGWGVNSPEGVSIHCVTDVLAAGAHTVTIEWATGILGFTATLVSCLASTKVGIHTGWLVVEEVPA